MSHQRNEVPTQEEIRDYWDRRPCNIRHSPQPVGTREYFDQVEARKYRVEPHIPAFADFEAWRGRDVLEIGCGIGTDAANFARAGAHYTGIEISPRSLEVTKQRFDTFGLSGELISGDAEVVMQGFADRSFDLVYSFGVLHHTPNYAAVLDEAVRVLRPAGQLRIMVYAKHSFKAAMISAGLDQPEAQDHCPLALTFGQEELAALLIDRELNVLDVHQDHIFPFELEPYLRYEYQTLPWVQAMPLEAFAAMQRYLGWHLLAVAEKPQ